MLGAIAGDIIGSVYEARPIKTRDFPYFHPRCRFTDDTVLTVAVARAIREDALASGRLRTNPRAAMAALGDHRDGTWAYWDMFVEVGGSGRAIGPYILGACPGARLPLERPPEPALAAFYGKDPRPCSTARPRPKPAP
jgi:hypothetical protein